MVREKERWIWKICLRCGHGRLSRAGRSVVIGYAVVISLVTSSQRNCSQDCHYVYQQSAEERE